MSDVARNDRSRGVWPVEPGDSHDEFLELCALASSDILNPREQRLIEGHLRECATCSEAYAQYRALLDVGVPSIFVDSEEKSAGPASSVWSMDEAHAALFARLDREQEAAQNRVGRSVIVSPTPPEGDSEIRCRPRPEPADILWHHMWWQLAAAVLLVLAMGVSLYRTGIRKDENPVAAAAITPPVVASAKEKSEVAKANLSGPGILALNDAEASEISALSVQLRNKADHIANLENEITSLEQALRANHNDRDRLAQASDLQRQHLAVSEADLATARQQLVGIENQDSQDKALFSTLEKQVEQLRDTIATKDQEIARDQDLLDHDRDIRELMGSRKLYVTEVYDVAKNGQTERPFGRVFYTKGKSLIFYAYDLDQHPDIHEASSFQVWGRKGLDSTHVVNLGIFYADNAANKRWVLRSDDTTALADLNAVFVTVEPHGGSSHPNGKPLLFAYLRIEPNHP